MRQPCPFSAAIRTRSTTAILTGLSVATLLLLQSATLHADQLARDLREWLAPLAIPSAELFSHHVTGTDVARFYAARDFHPAWSLPQQRQRLQQAIGTLAGDGFDPDRYPIPNIDTVDWQLCDELTTTASFLQAALHLHFGLIDRESIEPLWRHEEDDRRPQRRALLERARQTLDAPAELFDQARPALPLYHALRHAYLDLLAQSTLPPWPSVAAGPSLRPDTVDPRVAQLRARLAASAYWVDPVGVATGEHPDPSHYDAALRQAVLSFQRDHTLAADGIVGPATLAELNTSRHERVDQLRVNLERLRWRAGEHRAHMVLVDTAGGLLQYHRDGALQWQARAQVGTPARRTPDLLAPITHFTFNPSWTIPPTIFRHDKLPRIRTEPDYLARSGLEVLDSDGHVLDPEQIDWDRPGAVRLRQPPGPHNPLGQVAIRFPNPFAVYLHDTPSQQLFERAQRTVSSGCVRVEHAMNLVDQLIADASDFSSEYIAMVINRGRTGNIRLGTPVPLLMDYWTVELNDAGRVVSRPDIYRRDRALAQALRRAPSTAVPPCTP